jgi:molybdopterin converting factor small subunit
MSIRIHIPIFYRSESDEEELLVDDCHTVAECLGVLLIQYPELRKMLFDKRQRLRSWVGIYLNGEDAFPRELERPVKDGDEIRMFLYLSV